MNTQNTDTKANESFTPSTEQVRHGYVWSFREDLYEAKGDGFDQWLRALKAEVWLEAAAPLIRDSWGVEHEEWCGCDNENRHFENPYVKKEA